MTIFYRVANGPTYKAAHWKTTGTGSDTADLKWAFFSHFLSTTSRQTCMFLSFSLITALNYAFLGTIDMEDGLCLQTHPSGLPQSLRWNKVWEAKPDASGKSRCYLMLIYSPSYISCFSTTYVVCMFHLHHSSMNTFHVCQRWRTKLSSVSSVQPRNSFLLKQKLNN